MTDPTQYDTRREYFREYMRSYSKTAAYREKRRARDAVYRAIKTGKLNPQPCETCGTHDVDAHHDDHTQPLNVRWICHPCHMRMHHKQRRHENDQQPLTLAA